MLVQDTSVSMKATDVRPDRVTAARERGAHAHPHAAGRVPPRPRLVQHRRRAAVGAEHGPHARRCARWTALTVHGATAMGDGLAARARRDPHAGDRRRRAAGAAARRDRAALGRREHARQGPAGDRAARQALPACRSSRSPSARRTACSRTRTAGASASRRTPQTLQQIARTTSGRFFTAPTERDLEAVYANLGRGLSKKKEKQEVTAAFAGGALALLLGGVVISLLRTGRVP